jgi:phosphatidylglycerol lysyltransferase
MLNRRLNYHRWWQRLHHLYRQISGVSGIACLTAIMGAVNLLSAIYPSLPDRRAWLETLLPFALRAESRLFALFSGFLLVTLAATLRRRKQWAWRLTVGLLILSIITHLAKGLDYEECLLAAVLLVQLWRLRSRFTARSDRASITQGIRVLGISLGFTLAYGTIGFYILDDRFAVNGQPTNFGWIAALSQTLLIFFTEDNAGLAPIGRYATYFINSLYTIGLSTLAYSLLMLLRPVLLKNNPASQMERQAARLIIDQSGISSLARLALLHDKAYFFSPSGQTVFAYVPKGRAALVLGDPIGPVSDQVVAIAAFQNFCQRNDWFPVFYQALPQMLPLYAAAGFQAVQIGEEAIVDLRQFTLKGKANQNLRTAVNRLTKTGHRFVLFEPPIADDLLQQLKPVSDAWLQAKRGSEKRFSIAWFDREHLRDCSIGVVYDSHGQAMAFVNLLTGYGQSEMTVDLMRHRSSVENGTMEFLFISLMQYAQQQGYDQFSLSLSPLAGVGLAPDARRIERGLNYFFEHLNQFYDFKGLHQFKAKFQPGWVPRYLIYPHPAMLPEIAVALVRADSGDRLWNYLKSD